MTGNGIPGPPGGPPQNPPPGSGAVNWQKAAPPQAPQQQPQQQFPPQQQQFPPQQQPQQGYGYPQQAAAPPQGYGAVPPPGQQQYGGGQQPPPPPAAHGPYPGQAAPYGAPAPASPAKKGKTGLILLLVVALLVLGGAGAGAWFLLSPSVDENVLWSQPGYKGKMPPGETVQQLDGTWTTDKTLIQALPDGVKAYDLATGKRLWATPLPGDSNVACSAPRQSDGDIGIIGFGDNKACNNIAAYDLNTGKQLWTKELKKQPKPKPKPGADDRFKPGGVELPWKTAFFTRSGGAVISQGFGGMQALKASDGSLMWKTAPTAKCDTPSFTGGKVLIRVRACHTKRVLGVPYDEVSRVDPETGEAMWTHTFQPESKDELDAGMVTGQVVSTDPIVLQLNRQDMGLISLDKETGKIHSRFSPKEPAKYVQTHSPDGSPWAEAAAFGKTFVMSVVEGNSENLLAAYDLDSGKLLWKTKPDKSKDYHLLPGTDGGKILAYVRINGNDKGPELVEYNPKTGTPRTLVEYPERVADGISLHLMPTVRDDTMYLTAIPDRTFNPLESYGIIALRMSQPQ